MTQTKSDRAELCLDCGSTIEDAVLLDRSGPFHIPQRQTRCGECGFHEFFRSRHLMRRPYQQPHQRPTATGKAPAEYLNALAEYKQANRLKQEEGP